LLKILFNFIFCIFFLLAKEIAGLTEKDQRTHQKRVRIFGMKLSIKGLRFVVCLLIALFGVIYGS
jgi:hypothetical protein